jgi:hypothetical protein
MKKGHPRGMPLAGSGEYARQQRAVLQVLWLPVQVFVQTVVLSMFSDLLDSGSSRRSRSPKRDSVAIVNHLTVVRAAGVIGVAAASVGAKFRVRAGSAGVRRGGFS